MPGTFTGEDPREEEWECREESRSKRLPFPRGMVRALGVLCAIAAPFLLVIGAYCAYEALSIMFGPRWKDFGPVQVRNDPRGAVLATAVTLALCAGCCRLAWGALIGRLNDRELFACIVLSFVVGGVVLLYTFSKLAMAGGGGAALLTLGQLLLGGLLTAIGIVALVARLRLQAWKRSKRRRRDEEDEDDN